MYKVLKSFKGSPDGRFAVDYEKDAIVSLTDSLAEVALAEGWVERVESSPSDDEAPAMPASQGEGSAKKSKPRSAGNK